uniref:Uncharacterized protein n=1 Tax=Cacopsylla melanoneura TaxID=428564 RepID=A0A8D9FBM5_9HEMI
MQQLLVSQQNLHRVPIHILNRQQKQHLALIQTLNQRERILRNVQDYCKISYLQLQRQQSSHQLKRKVMDMMPMINRMIQISSSLSTMSQKISLIMWIHIPYHVPILQNRRHL